MGLAFNVNEKELTILESVESKSGGFDQILRVDSLNNMAVCLPQYFQTGHLRLTKILNLLTSPLID